MLLGSWRRWGPRFALKSIQMVFCIKQMMKTLLNMMQLCIQNDKMMKAISYEQAHDREWVAWQHDELNPNLIEFQWFPVEKTMILYWKHDDLCTENHEFRSENLKISAQKGWSSSRGWRIYILLCAVRLYINQDFIFKSRFFTQTWRFFTQKVKILHSKMKIIPL